MVLCVLARRAGLTRSTGLRQSGGMHLHSPFLVFVISVGFVVFLGFSKYNACRSLQASSLLVVDPHLHLMCGIGIADATMLAKTSSDPATTNEAQE